MKPFLKAFYKMAAIIWGVILVVLAVVGCGLLFWPEALWQGVRYCLVGVCILGAGALALPLIRILFK